jgi:adenylyltransferase/sulfurtransferase
VNVNIPAALLAYTDGEQSVSAAGETVGEVIEALIGIYPQLRQHLFDGEGKMCSAFNLYLNDDEIRSLPRRAATLIEEDDELTILPAIAGGACLSL